ncbi:MAG: hypothetical protein WBP81_14480 [Solirubrobacteraceae bacterium]
MSGAAKCTVVWPLFDRYSTINEQAPERHYFSDADAVRLVPGAGPAVRRMKEALQAVVVVTNPRSVARALFTPKFGTPVDLGVNSESGRPGR